jgi:hypothetical protein
MGKWHVSMMGCHALLGTPRLDLIFLGFFIIIFLFNNGTKVTQKKNK